jgi:glycosyltransferase involved in cell wall biosynthesis
MKKIIIVTGVNPLNTGGVEVSIKRILNAISLNSEVKIDVVHLSKKSSLLSNGNQHQTKYMGCFMIPYYNSDYIKLYTIIDWSRGNDSFNYPMWDNYSIDHYITLKQLIVENEYDVIHAFFVDGAAHIATLIGQELGIPCISSFRGSDLNFAMYNSASYTLVSQVVARSSALTVMNQDMLSKIIRLFRSDIICEITPIGISETKFKSQGTIKNFELPPNSYVIAYLGMIKKRKGWAFFMEIINRLRELGIPAIAYVIGDVDEHDKNWFTELKRYLSDYIFITGTVPHEDILLYLNKAHIVLQPSISEGGPNAILEAMISKTPIVTSLVGIVPEYLKHEQSALIFNPGDIEEATNLCKLLWGNNVLARRLVDAAYSTAIQCSVEKEINPFLSLYNKLGRIKA